MTVSVLISNSQPKCPNTFEIHALSAISYSGCGQCTSDLMVNPILLEVGLTISHLYLIPDAANINYKPQLPYIFK